MQRHGKTPELRCHLIDLDALNFLDVINLRRFLSDDGEILSRKVTGLCAKCQRQVNVTFILLCCIFSFVLTYSPWSSFAIEFVRKLTGFVVLNIHACFTTLAGGEVGKARP